MTRGPRKHLKRSNAPKSWGLDKSGGTYAPKPSSGPHRLAECIPLCILLTKKLKYANTSKELKYIIKNKMVKINNIVRVDKDFPVGFMDVVSIESTNEHFRLLYSLERKFILHKIDGNKEGGYRLCKVVKKKILKKNTPVLYTNDGYTFKYCNPEIDLGYTVKIDNKANRVVDFLPLKPEMRAFITKGKNLGCIGTISSIEKHVGGYDIVHMVDAKNRSFSTRVSNAFVIGDPNELWISVPEGQGIKVSEIERSDMKYGPIVQQETLVEE